MSFFFSWNAMQVYSRLHVCVVFLLFLSVVCVCVLVHSAYAMHATQHVRHMYQFRVHSKGPPPTPLLLLFLLVSCLGFVVVFRFLLLACFSLSVLSSAVCLSVCLLACCLDGGGSLHEYFVY